MSEQLVTKKKFVIISKPRLIKKRRDKFHCEEQLFSKKKKDTKRRIGGFESERVMEGCDLLENTQTVSVQKSHANVNTPSHLFIYFG